MSSNKKQEIDILPKNNRVGFSDFLELIDRWPLVYSLAFREIQVRYKQTVIGVLWALVQPIMTTVIFTFVFGILAKIPAPKDVPYPVFVFSGLLMWQYIGRVIADASGAFVSNAHIITKVYFPRLLLPMVPIIAGGIDLLIAMLVLFALMAAYGIFPGFQILLLPVALIFAIFLSYGIGIILAPINAIYRDVGIVIPFVLQVAMYLTPVIYPVTFVPERFQWVFVLNPFATILDLNRAALLGTELPSVAAFGVLLAFILFLNFFGLVIFKNLERTIVDRI